MANARHQQGIIKRYYEHRDTISLQKLGEIASDLFLCDDPKKADRLWKQAAKALAHTDADPAAAQRIVTDRDVAGLSKLTNQLAVPGQRPGVPETAASTPKSTPPIAPKPETPTPTDPLDKQVLKAALKAFRKRLKLTRLDEESKLGVGPLTGGRQSGVVAITPPNQYPHAVWEELVKQGKLKRAGTGFYALPGP